MRSGEGGGGGGGGGGGALSSFQLPDQHVKETSVGGNMTPLVHRCLEHRQTGEHRGDLTTLHAELGWGGGCTCVMHTW